MMKKTIFTLLALFAFTTAAVVIDASIYTYMQVSSDKGPVWLAASKTTVAKGDTISYPDGNVMTNFTSKSLNRTFDKIIFLDKVKVEKKK
jgi:hypothetical protein